MLAHVRTKGLQAGVVASLAVVVVVLVRIKVPVVPERFFTLIVMDFLQAMLPTCFPIFPISLQPCRILLIFLCLPLSAQYT